MAELQYDRLPRHVAVIMDGNGRWAEQRGLERSEGHRAGVEAVRQIVRAADELGVGWLTLYAFSSENWNRPKAEVELLMKLPSEFFETELARGDPAQRAHPRHRAPGAPAGPRAPLARRRHRAHRAQHRHAARVRALLRRARRDRRGGAPSAARARPGSARARGARREELRGLPGRAGAAGRGPPDPHRRRAAHLELPALAERLRRAGAVRRALARLRSRRARSRTRRLRGPRAPLRAHQRAGARWRRTAGEAARAAREHGQHRRADPLGRGRVPRALPGSARSPPDATSSASPSRCAQHRARAGGRGRRRRRPRAA